METNDNFDGKKFGSRLKELRKLKGLKLRELEDLSGVSNAYLSQLENGKRGKPSPEIIKKIAPHLEASYTELMKDAGYLGETLDNETKTFLDNYEGDLESIFDYAFTKFLEAISHDGFIKDSAIDFLLESCSELDPNGELINHESAKQIQTWKMMFDYLSFQEKIDFILLIKNEIDIPNENLKSKGFEKVNNFIRVPVLGYIAAGQPVFVQEHIYDFEYIPNSKNYKENEVFLLIVKGDSMIGNRIYPGDKVLVKIQPEVENGEIAVVNVNGYEATLKKVKKYEDGSVWLISSNENYAPIPLNDTNSRIIGKVVQVIFEP